MPLDGLGVVDAPSLSSTGRAARQAEQAAAALSPAVPAAEGTCVWTRVCAPQHFRV